jgi:hypothetical protein
VNRFLHPWQFRAAACAAALLMGACARAPSGDPCENARRSGGRERHWCVVLETRIPLGGADVSAGADLLVRPDTLLYVLLPSPKQVRVFDPRGQQVRTFGGPASADTFARPIAFGWAEPLLWIYDADASRTFFFDPRGMRNSIVPMPLFTPAGNATTFLAALNHDNWLVLLRAAGQGVSEPRPLLVRQTSGLIVADTLLALTHPLRTLALNAEGVATAPAVTLPQPFAERSFVATSSIDGMIVIAEPSLPQSGRPALVLTKITQEGDTVFSRQHRYRPVRLSAQRIQQEVNRLQAEAQRIGHGGIGAREIEARLYRPAHLPTVTALVIATDGTVLIRREDRAGQTVDWSIFTPSGDPVATQTTLAATDFRAAAGPYFFGLERDSAGALMAARYRALEANKAKE